MYQLRVCIDRVSVGKAKPLWLHTKPLQPGLNREIETDHRPTYNIQEPGPFPVTITRYTPGDWCRLSLQNQRVGASGSGRDRGLVVMPQLWRTWVLSPHAWCEAWVEVWRPMDELKIQSVTTELPEVACGTNVDWIKSACVRRRGKLYAPATAPHFSPSWALVGNSESIIVILLVLNTQASL